MLTQLPFIGLGVALGGGGGGGGPAGDVTIAVQDFATGTSTGVQDISSSTLTGITPKGALIIGAFQNVADEPGETAGASWSLGFCDGSGDRRARGYSLDAQASTVARAQRDLVGYSLVGNSTVELKNAEASPSLGGIEFDFATNSSPSMRVFYVAFAGSDLQAYSLQTSLGTGTSAIDITSPGFEPDVLLAISCCTATSASIGWFSFGITVNDGLDTQRCICGAETNGAAAGQPFKTLRNDAVMAKISNSDGSLISKVTAGDFDSSGFSLTPSASAGSATLEYLAIDLGGRQFALVDFETPTSTGDDTISGAGFTPSFALVVLTGLESVNDHPGSSTDNMAGFAISAIGDDEQWSAGWRMDSGADPTDTASQISNAAIMGPSATDCDAILASFVAWTSDGVTVNYSAVQGSGKKGFILFVE